MLLFAVNYTGKVFHYPASFLFLSRGFIVGIAVTFILNVILSIYVYQSLKNILLYAFMIIYSVIFILIYLKKIKSEK